MSKLLLYIFTLFLMSNTTIDNYLSIPVRTQIPIFLKILEWDKNIISKEQGNKDFLIGILYQPKNPISSSIFTEIWQFESQKFILKQNNRRIKFLPLEMNSTDNLENLLKKNLINAVIITPLRAVEISEIVKITQSNKILSFGLLSHYTSMGVALSLDIKADRPQILINLSSAKKEGADFSSNLLKLAKIIDAN